SSGAGGPRNIAGACTRPGVACWRGEGRTFCPRRLVIQPQGRDPDGSWLGRSTDRHAKGRDLVHPSRGNPVRCRRTSARRLAAPIVLLSGLAAVSACLAAAVAPPRIETAPPYTLEAIAGTYGLFGPNQVLTIDPSG